METIIYLGAFGALLQYVPQWEWVLKKLRLNFKPFNCPLCFTFWGSLAYLSLTQNLEMMEIIFIASGAALLAELLWRKLNTY